MVGKLGSYPEARLEDIEMAISSKPTSRDCSHFIFVAGFNVIQDQGALSRMA